MKNDSVYCVGGSNVNQKDKKKKSLITGNNKKKGSYWGNSKSKKGSTTPIEIKKS